MKIPTKLLFLALVGLLMNACQMQAKSEDQNQVLTAKAFAEAIKIAPKLNEDTIIIVNSCGDAKKDRDILRERLGKK